MGAQLVYICPDYRGYSLNFDTEILLCRLYILALISTGEPENISIGCCGCSLKREYGGKCRGWPLKADVRVDSCRVDKAMDLSIQGSNI